MLLSHILAPACGISFFASSLLCTFIHSFDVITGYARCILEGPASPCFSTLQQHPPPTPQFDMVAAQIATRQLVPLVETSQLPSRSQISDALVRGLSDLKDIQRGLYDLGAIIAIGTDQILAATDHSHRLSSMQWVSPDGLLCYCLGSYLLRASCHYANNARLAMSLDIRHVAERSTRDMIMAIGVVMERLERFDQRLLRVHHLALNDGVQLNGTRPSLLHELWLLVGNKAEHHVFVRNSAILEQTEQYVHTTTSYTFWLLKIIQEIHSQTTVAHQYMGKSVASLPGLQVVRSTAHRLREANRIHEV
ncbi:hypothetical protein AB1N83_010700 [Pleurotus pulmonarius]